jgi:type II secretory pathway component PulF
MPRYRITAASAGEVWTRSEEAPTPDIVAARFSALGHTILKIEPDNWRSWLDILHKDIEFKPPLSLRDVSLLAQEWATMLKAGLPLKDVLSLSVNATRRTERLRVLTSLAEDVKAGRGFHTALEAHPRCFPKDMAAMVRAGEASGTLAESLTLIAGDLRERLDFSDRLRSALIYPVFLSVTASAAIVMLLVVVVPNLETLIGDAQGDLPAMTQMVMGLSAALRSYGIYAAAGGLLALLLLWLAARSPGVQLRLHRLVLKLPLVGASALDRDVSRFLRSLGSLFQSGVDLTRAMSFSSEAVKNLSLRNDLAVARTRVVEGQPLVKALRGFPDDALAFIQMGEKTGRLADALMQAGQIAELRCRRRLEKISAMIGPILTLSFGFVCGVIVYAMLTTILSVNEIAFQGVGR